MVGIKDIVGGIMGSVPGQKATSPQVGNRSSARVASGDVAGFICNTVATVLAFITGTAHAAFFKIWQRTVPAQMLLSWGFGSPAFQQNQGYMWFASLDVAADWDVGVLRLAQSDHAERDTRVVLEMPDSSFHTTTVTTLATATPTDKNTMIPLPEKVEFPFIREDSLLALHYALLTAATAHDAVGFEIPITEYVLN